jgi:hypothetical protein
MALLASLEPAVDPDNLALLINVAEDEYNVSVFLQGELLIYRHKTFAEEMSDSARQQSVHRNLRLTTSFVQEHFPGNPLARVFLAAPSELEDHWMHWLADEFGVVPEALAQHHFSLAVGRAGMGFLETASLLGAATLRVA